jgi:hypothetical protein
MKAWIIEKELRGIREIEGHIVDYEDIEVFRTDYGDFEIWFKAKEAARLEAVKIRAALICELQDEIKRLAGLVF